MTDNDDIKKSCIFVQSAAAYVRKQDATAVSERYRKLSLKISQFMIQGFQIPWFNVRSVILR